MLAFEVSKNGDVVYVAGMAEWHYMSTQILAMNDLRLGNDLHPGNGITLRTAIPGSSPGPPKALVWEQLALKVGDEITIRIIETDKTDPPEEEKASAQILASVAG